MYKLFNFKEILVRQSIILVLSLFFGFSTIADKPELFTYFGVLRSLLWNYLFISSIWNFNLLLIKNRFFDKWTWEKDIRKKLSYALVVALGLPTLLHYLFNQFLFEPIMGIPCQLGDKENVIFLIITVTITLLINAIMIALEFFNHWKKLTLEKETLKRITLAAEFESLKNQVNPHFLFNALNTLTNIIDESPETATKFVQKLSSVYRYLLSQKEKEIVSLGEELDFMQSYVYLYQLRFGDNFKVSMSIPKELLHKNIITLTLQMLLENAIKHNVISKDKPLHIFIEANENQLCVSNNFQPKTILSESNGIGLTNIQSRYAMVCDQKVVIRKDQDKFSVCVPLI